MNEPFDLCYANLKSSNLARDAMQMMMRCRVLNDETVYFSMSKRQIYNTSNIPMFETFELSQDDRYKRTFMLIKDLKKNEDKNKDLIDMLMNTLETTDEVLLKTMWYNMREHMLSQCHYNSMCIYLLKKQGYKVVLLKDTDHNKDTVPEKIVVDYVAEYNWIDDIDNEDVQKLKHSNTTIDERLCIDKHFFEKMTIGELPCHVKGKLFFEYYQTSYKKHHLSNIKYEKSTLSDDFIINKDFEKNDLLVSKMSMISKKLKYMREFNEILDLDNSCENGKVINKKLITGKVLDHMNSHIKDLVVLYKSKIKLTGDKRNDNFCALKLLQKIYNDWSGLAFKKCSSNKNGDASHYVTECFDYYDCIAPYKTERSMEDVMMFDDE